MTTDTGTSCGHTFSNFFYSAQNQINIIPIRTYFYLMNALCIIDNYNMNQKLSTHENN